MDHETTQLPSCIGSPNSSPGSTSVSESCSRSSISNSSSSSQTQATTNFSAATKEQPGCDRESLLVLQRTLTEDVEGPKDSITTKPQRDIGPVEREFHADPSHEFWKWCRNTQNWYHKVTETGSVLWAPHQL
ncbi:hypothetical protein BDP81DRAFT_432710, partial [Colletotrichum phormii]